MRRSFLSLLLFFLAFAPFAEAQRGDPFLEMSSEHFRVRFTMEGERDAARAVLRRAEEYYIRIADDIGYSRYQDFWTWEKRVVIVLYPDQYAYARFTGSPQWSKGYASRDTRLFKQRTIVSYSGQDDFLGEILPHEIAHLMMWDYLKGVGQVPVWFEEGVAGLQEARKVSQVNSAMRPVVLARRYIPFELFKGMTITGEKDNIKVSLFYAQSLSIVLFLIQKHGVDAFHRLFHGLGEGRSFEQALGRAYPSSVRTMADLEQGWVRYLEEQ